MAKVQKTADTATAAAYKMGARVRMTEGNTCYRGDKPGVSDVFAAALCSDYSLNRQQQLFGNQFARRGRGAEFTSKGLWNLGNRNGEDHDAARPSAG
jgi:hypothetical protein